MIPGVIHKCYIAKQEAKPLIILGSGKPLRQFLYANDVAKLLIWALNEYESIEPVILADDENKEVSIREVAEEIARAFHFKVKSYLTGIIRISKKKRIFYNQLCLWH